MSLKVIQFNAKEENKWQVAWVVNNTSKVSSSFVMVKFEPSSASIGESMS